MSHFVYWQVGEVVGAAGAEGSERSSGKSLYKGKVKMANDW